MKKMLKNAVAVAAGLLVSVTMLTGCGSTPSNEAAPAPAAPQETFGSDIVEWKDMRLGAEKVPAWFKGGVINEPMLRSILNLEPNRVIRLSTGEGMTQAVADTIADVDFSYNLSVELKQSVIGKKATALNALGEKEAVASAATKTRADVAGWRKETQASFWQKIEVLDDYTGQKSYKYYVYNIFTADKKSWDNLVTQYVSDLLQDPTISKEAKKEIAGLYEEMKDEGLNKDPAKTVEEKKAYKEAMEDVAPAEGNSAEEQKMKEAEERADFINSFLQ